MSEVEQAIERLKTPGRSYGKKDVAQLLADCAALAAEVEQLKDEVEQRGEKIAAIHTALDKAKAFRPDGSHGQGASRVGLLGDKIEELQEEIAVDDKLLATRQELLDLFDCPAHGPCVPFAIEEVKRLRAMVDADDEYFRLLQALALKGLRDPPTDNERQARMDAWGVCVEARAAKAKGAPDG